ncbi:hypothetical protein [Micromonospora echinospora]|uniref:hypothetical protein n=1 Tax=Micromonospora echinospora TaxID=1877 RepID=UPI0012FDF9B3|nr:hypothetical protein [Micromonospora echinospora]
MSSNKLVLAELSRYDWSQFRCGCRGTAEHVPEIFRAIVDAVEPEDAYGAVLDGHLEVEGNLFEVAVPAVGVILAALAGDLSTSSRSELLETLWRLVGGDSHHTEMALGRTRLGDECRHKAREGIWVILQEGFGKHGEEVIDILELIDLDEARHGYYAEILKRRKKARR